MDHPANYGEGEAMPAPGERDPVRELLLAAGLRPAVESDRTARVRQAVFESWQDTVRTRRRTVRLQTVAAAVAMAAALLVAVRFWPRAAVPSADVMATLEAATGPVQLTSAVDGGTAGERTLRVGDVLRRGALLRTPGGTHAAIRLQGGVSMRLDTGTVVRLEASNDVTLERGGIYVDTDAVNEPGSRLRVRTRFGVAHDIGTRFEVRLQEAELRIRVRDGIVQLDQEAGSHTAKGGVELMADSSGNISRQAVPVHGTVWDWVTRAAPPLTIEGQTLATFLAWVEREGGLRVRFVDDTLARRAASTIVHGSVEGLTPRESLDVVLPTCGLGHAIRDGVVVISASAASGVREAGVPEEDSR